MHSSQAMGQKNRPRAVDPDGAQAGVLQAGLVVMCKKGGWTGGGREKGHTGRVFFFFFFFWLHFLHAAVPRPGTEPAPQQ